jgi:hypothetical protein
VIARALGDRPWASPDAALEVRDGTTGYPFLAGSAGWPDAASPDPRLYFAMDTAHPRVLRVLPELASAGAYFLHVRRAAVIREICAEIAGSPAFVELDLTPGADLAGYEVRLVDPDGAWADAVLPLAGTVPGDGLVVIGPAGDGAPDVVDFAGVTVFPAGIPYAVQLAWTGVVIDALEVDGDGTQGEGDPVSSDGAPRCYARPVGIDTNQNAADFVPNWIATPGA